MLGGGASVISGESGPRTASGGFLPLHDKVFERILGQLSGGVSKK